MTEPKPRLEKMLKAVEAAIAEHNRNYAGKIRIVWGYPDKDEEEFAQTAPEPCRTQPALLNAYGRDFELELSSHGDPDHPDRCRISASLESYEPLPRTNPRDLYNLLTACAESVTLRLLPDGDDTRCGSSSATLRP